MNKKTFLRERLLLLLILAIAAEFLFLLPQNNSKNKELSQIMSKSNDKTDKDSIDCSNQNSEISSLLDNEESTSSNSCLFMGCSGFYY